MGAGPSADGHLVVDGINAALPTNPDSPYELRDGRVRAGLDAVPGLPIQVQIEPPADLSVLAELRAAGAVSIGIHVESLDDDVRRKWMPGKGSVPMSEYEAAWDEAVRLFGRNRVS